VSILESAPARIVESVSRSKVDTGAYSATSTAGTLYHSERGELETSKSEHKVCNGQQKKRVSLKSFNLDVTVRFGNREIDGLKNLRGIFGGISNWNTS
jgi:hypothetical protein